jgi:hypothetical protein
MALNVSPKILYHTKTFECFELIFSPLSTCCFRKKTSSPPPFGSGDNFSLFVLLKIVELIWFQFC